MDLSKVQQRIILGRFGSLWIHHKLYLGYLKSFLKVYKDSPVFMFSLENEPSHDYLNTVGVSYKWGE